jgi:hypothetical protein
MSREKVPSFSLRKRRAGAEHACGISRNHRVSLDVAGDDRGGADNAAGTERDAGQNERAGADKDVCFHHDRRGLQRDVRLGEIVRAGAKVNFLRDGRAGVEHDVIERVSMGAIAEAGAMVQGEVPRLLDARALMHEGRAVNLCAKYAQHEEPPRIEWLRRPSAREQPHVLPNKQQKSSAQRPWRRVRAGLIVSSGGIAHVDPGDSVNVSNKGEN